MNVIVDVNSIVDVNINVMSSHHDSHVTSGYLCMCVILISVSFSFDFDRIAIFGPRSRFNSDVFFSDQCGMSGKDKETQAQADTSLDRSHRRGDQK